MGVILFGVSIVSMLLPCVVNFSGDLFMYYFFRYIAVLTLFATPFAFSMHCFQSKKNAHKRKAIKQILVLITAIVPSVLLFYLTLFYVLTIKLKFQNVWKYMDAYIYATLLATIGSTVLLYIVTSQKLYIPIFNLSNVYALLYFLIFFALLWLGKWGYFTLRMKLQRGKIKKQGEDEELVRNLCVLEKDFIQSKKDLRYYHSSLLLL